MLTRRRSLGAIAFAANALYSPARAQVRYPTRPITLMVGFVPGGSTDFIARLLARRLSDTLGQPVVVENRGGANGLIASNALALAAADGYTLLLTSMGLTTNPHLYTNANYDPAKKFTAIAMLTAVPNIIVAHPSLPARDLQELLALARSRPAPLTLGTTGNAAPGHLASMVLERAANVRFEFVPYKGSGPVITDLIAGHVDLSLPALVSVYPFVKAGKLRAFAVTGAKRSALLPDVPTIAEAGVPGLSSGSGWYGLVGPAGMPKDVVERIATEVEKFLKTPDIADKLVSNGADPMFMNPAQMASFIERDYRQWGDLVRSARMKPETP